MSKVINVSKEKFFEIHTITEIDLVGDGFFSIEDLENMNHIEAGSSMRYKLNKVFSYLPFTLSNPEFARRFIFPSMAGSLLSVLGVSSESLNTTFIKQYNLRASIVAALKPKNLLEIGTYLGWGAAAFKFVVPKCNVYTMNPKVDEDSNNPIDKEDVGIVCKKKRLKIRQIWADSTNYDYSKLPMIDLVYIDGNHAYDYVLSDLRNMNELCVGTILIDDYIPKQYALQYGLVFSPWNESVVSATGDFLKSESTYKQAYWITGTKLCVLIRQ